MVRAPAGFAYECPQSQWIRFSYANRGTGKSRKGGPGACRVCVRVPAKPMDSVFVRKPGHRKEQKRWPGRLQGLRTTARKANEYGFRTQTGAPERAEKAVRAPATAVPKKKKGKCQPFRGIFLLFFIFPRRVGTISRRACTIPRRVVTIPPQPGRLSWHSAHSGAAPG